LLGKPPLPERNLAQALAAVLTLSAMARDKMMIGGYRQPDDSFREAAAVFQRV